MELRGPVLTLMLILPLRISWPSFRVKGLSPSVCILRLYSELWQLTSIVTISYIIFAQTIPHGQLTHTQMFSLINCFNAMKSNPDEKFIVRLDGRIISQEPILMLQYYSTSEEQRTLRVAGEQHPLYVVNRRAKLGGIWGHKFEVCSTNRGRDVASIDFHSIPQYCVSTCRSRRPRSVLLAGYKYISLWERFMESQKH
jgi:hypothetical protein